MIRRLLDWLRLSPRKIRLVTHLRPFDFEGVDRFSILDQPIATVKTPIPFGESAVVVTFMAFDPTQHVAMDGREADEVHRFARPNADGYPLDFLVHEGRLIQVNDSANAYRKR